jgi:hypothetical protein
MDASESRVERSSTEGFARTGFSTGKPNSTESNDPTNLTRHLGIAVDPGLSTTYIFFGEAIAEWWNPPEELVLTTDEFIAAVKDPTKRDEVAGKKASLSGVAKDDYASSRPRIALDLVVEVNIHAMAGGDPIPETLRGELQFSGVVESISPLEIGGD